MCTCMIWKYHANRRARRSFDPSARLTEPSPVITKTQHRAFTVYQEIWNMEENSLNTTVPLTSSPGLNAAYWFHACNSSFPTTMYRTASKPKAYVPAPPVEGPSYLQKTILPVRRVRHRKRSLIYHNPAKAATGCVSVTCDGGEVD